MCSKRLARANPDKAKKGLNSVILQELSTYVLSNLENINSILIRNQIDKPERFRQLRDIVQIQIKSLDAQDFMKALKKVSDDIYIDNKKKLK